jgi:glutaredoxin-related protein
MYIKSWCGNSKAAVKKLVKEGFEQIILFDVETNSFVCPEKWTPIQYNRPYNLKRFWKKQTVPQVYVRGDMGKEWSFLKGGNSAVQNINLNKLVF